MAIRVAKQRPVKNTLFYEHQTFYHHPRGRMKNMHAIRRIRRALHDITYKRTKKRLARRLAQSYGIIEG